LIEVPDSAAAGKHGAAAFRIKLPDSNAAQKPEAFKSSNYRTAVSNYRTVKNESEPKSSTQIELPDSRIKMPDSKIKLPDSKRKQKIP
jgi:hypothetical protein